MGGDLHITTTGDEATMDLGNAIGEALHAPLVIALYGEMGSGKTTFVRGLAKGLGVHGVVNSPTYTLDYNSKHFVENLFFNLIGF